MTNKIIRNSAKCLVCLETLESLYRHNFVRCSCGNLAVDGGLDYIRRVMRTENYEELSLYEA